jgi:hypothetical protein
MYFGDEALNSLLVINLSFPFIKKEIILPPGDAQRAWFPEMIAIAKERWSKNMSWEDTILLCSEMQDLRDKIRREKQIKPVRIYCKKCEKYSLSTPTTVSPRSLLFMLKKENIITEDEFKMLEKDWNKYRKIHNLDAYGTAVDKIDKTQHHSTH